MLITLFLFLTLYASIYITYLIYEEDSNKGVRIHTKTIFHYIFDYNEIIGKFNILVMVLLLVSIWRTMRD